MQVCLGTGERLILILASLLILESTAQAANCAMSARAANLVAMIDRATLEMLNANGDDDPAPKGGRLRRARTLSKMNAVASRLPNSTSFIAG